MINRCICHSRSFEEVKAVALEEGYTTVEELQEDDICACGCGLCIPYVEMVLKSGETEFEYRDFYDK